jgi:hypothetical protein
MTEICGVGGVNPSGRSAGIANGGFSLLMTHYAYDGRGQIGNEIGNFTYYFSSGHSIWGNSQIWGRTFARDRNTVHRDYQHNDAYLYPVRCKKDR